MVYFLFALVSHLFRELVKKKKEKERKKKTQIKPKKETLF